MVFKVSKGGVRSGNTLRCLRSVRTKRYSSQACILSRSNLKPLEVPRFLESATEDQLVTSALASTDVLLSLNKKARWTLPAIVNHMIRSGHFSHGKTVVSLLERHKLKKKANCVSFVCNQSRVRNVVPKQKRYFSFNLDNIDSEQSIRQWKRQKAEAMKQIKPPVVKTVKVKGSKPVKTVEVFTVTGAARHGLTSSNPEYRVEIFHPCPQSCSLVYNPKYTNVQVGTVNDGEKEVKSNTKVSKNKRRYRKRFTSNDCRRYQEEMDLEKYWAEDYEDSDFDPVSDADSEVSCQERDGSFNDCTSQTEDNSQESESEDSLQFSENLLACLISQAEKARSLCGRERPPQRHKYPSRSCKENSQDMTDKSHIVYINSVPPAKMDESHIVNIDVATRKKKKRKRKNQRKAKQRGGEELKEEPEEKPKSSKYVNLQYGSVIMKSAEITPKILRAKYGYCYAEAGSEPRRFTVNVTDDVYNLLCTHKFTEQNAMYTSYLVFVHDGVYDEGLDTFKVTLNSNICNDTEFVAKIIAFQESSIESIMNHVACALLDMKAENFLSTDHPPSHETTMKPALKFVNDLMRVNVETYRTFDEISRLSQTDALQENLHISTSVSDMIKDLDTDVFCDICYENVNPSQAGSVSGTKLSRCGHTFCDDCWRSHFRARMNNGAQKMVCPGYDCEETVGPVTLLSLLHVSEVTKLFQRKCEGQMESMPNSRWCPNPSCGRIVKLGHQTSVIDASFDVACDCGEEFCCVCLSQPHWPATCGQAEEYQQKRSSLEVPLEYPHYPLTTDYTSEPPQVETTKKPEVMEIEGRVCPQCRKFIDKNGGCLHMSCHCGYHFCWDCLRNWADHNICKPDSTFVFEHTQKVRVNHIDIPQLWLSDTKDDTPTKPVRSRQRSSMYQKAWQQKSEASNCRYHATIVKMVRELARLGQKDLLVKREILSLCGTEVNDASEPSLSHTTFAPHVTKFLRSCVEIKRALHHVTEFTFVLAQDLPDSTERRRILKLADDLSSYCIFIKSILDLGPKQDVRAAVRRLADIQTWSKRTLNVLLGSVKQIKR